MALEVNRTCVVFKGACGPGTITRTMDVRAESVLLSLCVTPSSGDVIVRVYTSSITDGVPCNRKLIDTFPTISAPTTELFLRKEVEVFEHLEFEIECTGDAEIDLRAKGLSAGELSVTLQGADSWNVQNFTIGTTETLLIAAELADRNGLMIRNANFTGTEILEIAESEAKLLADVWSSILPGEAIQPDLRAGNEVWARSNTGTIRVEVVEVT